MQEIIDSLVTSNRKRSQWLRARTSLTNQIKAFGRSITGAKKGEKIVIPQELEEIYDLVVMPLAEARSILDSHIKRTEIEIAKAASLLPVSEWWISHKGMAVGGLAQIVGEAGDLAKYRNPSCLWKRFGLHVLPNGKAPKPKRGEKMDYSPRRRPVIKCIGNSIKMGGIQKKIVLNPYRALYDERKKYEIAKAPELKAGHHDYRAMRYMEKRLLRDLWCKWRNVEPQEWKAA